MLFISLLIIILHYEMLFDLPFEPLTDLSNNYNLLTINMYMVLFNHHHTKKNKNVKDLIGHIYRNIALQN